jgi:hypothetical protein
MNRKELCDVPWGVAQMGYRPSDAWLVSLAAFTLQQGLTKLGPSEVPKLTWSMATFAWMPPDEWLSVFALEAVYCPSMNPSGYAAVLWAMACFQVGGLQGVALVLYLGGVLSACLLRLAGCLLLLRSAITCAPPHLHTCTPSLRPPPGLSPCLPTPAP